MKIQKSILSALLQRQLSYLFIALLMAMFSIPVNGQAGAAVANSRNMTNLITGKWQATSQGEEWQIILSSETPAGNFSTTRLFRKNQLQAEGNGFIIARETGILNLSGKLGTEGGSGEYTFKENENFRATLKQSGIETSDKGELFILFLTDVNSRYLSYLKQNGFNQLILSQLQNLALQDFSLEELKNYVNVIRQVEPAKLSVDQLIAMKTMNATPQYINSLRNLGFRQLTLDDIMAARTHGIDSAFINSMIAAGHKNLSIRQLIELKVKSSNSQSGEKETSLNSK